MKQKKNKYIMLGRGNWAIREKFTEKVIFEQQQQPEGCWGGASEDLSVRLANLPGSCNRLAPNLSETISQNEVDSAQGITPEVVP